MPGFLWLLAFFIFSFTPPIVAMECYPSGIDPRINVSDCIAAWYEIFLTVDAQTTAREWNRIQVFNRETPSPKLRHHAVHGSCVVSLGAQGPDPTVTVNTSWKHLAQAVLDVMRECVVSSQHGFGGYHQDTFGVVYVITHSRAYAALMRAPTNNPRGSGR